jgi:asparagine synthetase B (glutamine-hydrolysing)
MLCRALLCRAVSLQGGGDVDLWGNRLHSFCIGLAGSPDLKAGAEVAKFLGTDHHEFTFTVQVRAGFL